MHQSSRKARQRDAERPAAQQDLTQQRQRIKKDSSIKGGNHQSSPRPNSAMKLATGLDEMPGRRGIPEVTGADGVLSGSLLVRNLNKKRKRERESAGQMEKKAERVGVGED